MMLCMVPINNLALGTLSPQKLKGASGLFNLTRNLGGAVGLAIINTVLTDRTALHVERLSEHVNCGQPGGGGADQLDDRQRQRQRARRRDGGDQAAGPAW